MQSENPQDDNKDINPQQILLQNSVFVVSGEITGDLSDAFNRWIIAENLNFSREPRTLTIIINSQGGDLYEAWAMIDLVKMSPHIIKTVAVGSCMSAALLLYSQGTEGHRFAGSNCSFMSHQHSDSLDQTKFHDTESYYRESQRNNDKMLRLLLERTNLTERQIRRTLLGTTDYYMTTEEAQRINLVNQTV